MLRQILHGGHAAALLVGDGRQGGLTQHFAVFHFHDGINIAMTEMHAHAGFHAAGQRRRNGYH